MKKLIFLAILSFSMIASAGFKNILPDWTTSSSLPSGSNPVTLSIPRPLVGDVEIKALITNIQAFDQKKPVNRLMIATKDEVNEYFFVLAENAKITEITSLKQSEKSKDVIEIDALTSEGKTLQFNILLIITPRLSAQSGASHKLFHGIVLYDSQGYRR